MIQTLVILLLCVQVQCLDVSLIDIYQNLNVNLSEKCAFQMQEFIANFSFSTNSWALQMVDSSPKVPSGLLSYNFGEMGNFHQCVNTQAELRDHTISGKYCLGYIGFSENKTLLNEDYENSIPSTTNVQPMWALCLPSGCTTNDINLIGNDILQTVSENIRINFSDLLCQTIKEANPALTPGAICTIVVIALLLTSVIASTCFDLYTMYYKKSCPLIVRGFSAYSNGQKIFKMSSPDSDQLPCLNGIKFISMMWVVIGHQYSIPMNGSITNSKDLLEWSNKLYSMFIVSGTLSVDTFLTIGGALMVYTFLKAKQKKVPFNLFLYYIHRYLRLTAPLAIVVLTSATLLKYLGSGPKWPFFIMAFQENCERNWWSTLLYIQNYVNVSKMCVGQTWYLNIDMQLYLISPAVFLALWKYPKLCMSFLCFSSAAFMGLSFYESWHNNLAAILSNIYNNNSAVYQSTYYLLTHTRSTPWVIGVILGYILFKSKYSNLKIKLNKTVVTCLWIVALATLLACILGGHSTLRSASYDKLGNAVHISFVRPVWSLAIAWIVLACALNFGGPVNWVLSLPIFQVLNRFTYSIYLTHVTLLYGIAYGRSWPDYFSDFNMTYQFWGTLWFSTGLAILLVFTTESPILTIEKILFGKAAKIGKTLKKADVENGLDNPTFENK